MASTEKIIELVKKYPMLYDLSHDDYKNIRKKDKIWKEIGQEVNNTGEDVKKKWKNLRDTYVRFIRINKKRSGRDSKTPKKWQWAACMEIFQPFLGIAKIPSNLLELVTEVDSTAATDYKIESLDHDGSQTSNISEVPEIEDVTRVSTTANIPIMESRKRKANQAEQTLTNRPGTKPTSSVESIINYFQQKGNSGNDPTDLLFLSYSSTIRKFSGKRQAETKLRIAEIIAQQEILHYEEQSLQQQVTNSRPSRRVNKS